MSIGVGGNYSNNTKTVREIKDTQGKVVGRITISKPKSKTVRKKRLPYNFRKISNQIVMSKTANSARAAMSSARRVTLLLKEKMRSSDYSDEELKDAIIHARKMERIAKKRVKNMEAEERAAQSGVYILELEEETAESEVTEEEQEAGLSQEELEKMMQELESLMEESMEELEDAAGLDDFMDGMMCVVQKDMEPEDLEQLKKKHRAEELQEIMEADMKYLKALFNRLEREKREGASGSSSNGSSLGAQSDSARGVSLQLAGTDIPVEQTAEVPAVTIAEGASVDIVL